MLESLCKDIILKIALMVSEKIDEEYKDKYKKLVDIADECSAFSSKNVKLDNLVKECSSFLSGISKDLFNKVVKVRNKKEALNYLLNVNELREKEWRERFFTVEGAIREGVRRSCIVLCVKDCIVCKDNKCILDIEYTVPVIAYENVSNGCIKEYGRYVCGDCFQGSLLILSR